MACALWPRHGAQAQRRRRFPNHGPPKPHSPSLVGGGALHAGVDAQVGSRLPPAAQLLVLELSGMNPRTVTAAAIRNVPSAQLGVSKESAGRSRALEAIFLAGNRAVDKPPPEELAAKPNYDVDMDLDPEVGVDEDDEYILS